MPGRKPILMQNEILILEIQYLQEKVRNSFIHVIIREKHLTHIKKGLLAWTGHVLYINTPQLA